MPKREKWTEPTREQLIQWVDNPFVSPLTGANIRGDKITPLTAFLRDMCLKNHITPPLLETSNISRTNVYREKVKKEKVVTMYEFTKNIIQWSKDNELPENEPDISEKVKLLEAMKVDLYHSVFASKV
jgi:hypothetical protein